MTDSVNWCAVVAVGLCLVFWRYVVAAILYAGAFVLCRVAEWQDRGAAADPAVARVVVERLWVVDRADLLAVARLDGEYVRHRLRDAGFRMGPGCVLERDMTPNGDYRFREIDRGLPR